MRIFVSALEHSADLYLANLVRTLRQEVPGVHVFGIAGAESRDAGCGILTNMVPESVMLARAAMNLPKAGRLLLDLDRTIFAHGQRAPDAAVLVDSPTFHLPLARRLKARGIPVLYYVAPQVWAWGHFRIRKIRQRVDALACILPFEEQFFRGHGINATFVGHPLLETLAGRQPDPEKLDRIRSWPKPLIVLMPGSRRQVVRSLLPDMLYCAGAIRRRWPRASFAVSVARKDLMPLIGDICRKHAADVRILDGWNRELLSAADLVLVASGTATIEVAFHHKPMVVLYKASRLGYWLVGRWLIRTPYLSLVNILAGEQLVPEFMPYYASPEAVANEVTELLANEPRRQRMAARLAEISGQLYRENVSQTVASMVLTLAKSHVRPTSGPLGSTAGIW